MKKVGFFFSLFVCLSLLAGCNKLENTEIIDNYTGPKEIYNITLSKIWRSGGEREDWPAYIRTGTFGKFEKNDMNECFFDMPRGSQKTKHISIHFLSPENITDEDFDNTNTEYVLNTFEEKNPYYPYITIPKIGFFGSVDNMKLGEDFIIECRDIDNLLDLDKRNCNSGLAINKSDFPFSIQNGITIEQLDDSDGCNKFIEYNNRYIIKSGDIGCWIGVNESTNVNYISYGENTF